MGQKRLLIMGLFWMLFLVSNVYGAIVHGSIYDIELNTLNDVVVEIDTIPKQRFVSKDGAYSFSVPVGNYVITANYDLNDTKLATHEKISVNGEGDYVFDLFLFPGFEEEDELLEDITDIPEEEIYEEQPTYLIYFIVAIIFIVAVIVFFKLMRLKKPKKIAEEFGRKDLDLVIDLLKKGGGRLTQKDLRKDIPLSEAKVSLLLAQLESEGKIKKIKKGRGNIIVLK